MSHKDEMAASVIMDWLGSRGSDRRPWKKVSSLARAYGAKRVERSRCAAGDGHPGSPVDKDS